MTWAKDDNWVDYPFKNVSEISAHFRTIHIRSEAKSLNHISAKSILYDRVSEKGEFNLKEMGLNGLTKPSWPIPVFRY